MHVNRDRLGCCFHVRSDRFRTMINVWGDSVGAGVVAQLSRRKLAEADHQHDVTGGGGGSTLDVNGALLNGKVTTENGGGKVVENGSKVTENGGNIYPDLKQTGAQNHGYDYTHM